MNNWVFDKNKQCYVFKQGGQIQKCGLGDVIQKGWAYMFNGQDGTFNEAFSKARNEGQKYFRWNGSLYNTKVKNTPLAETAPQLDVHHKFNARNFDEFVNVMYPIFEASFKKYNLPTTQMQNVIRQAAYESTYGTNPLGEQGYNLGGIKWFNDPKSNSYKYKHSTNPMDGQEYIDFNSLQDYADYKVNLLHTTYDALNASNTDDFVRRLHPGGDYNYSANPSGYKSTLNNMKSLDRAYERYMSGRK